MGGSREGPRAFRGVDCSAKSTSVLPRLLGAPLLLFWTRRRLLVLLRRLVKSLKLSRVALATNWRCSCLSTISAAGSMLSELMSGICGWLFVRPAIDGRIFELAV